VAVAYLQTGLIQAFLHYIAELTEDPIELTQRTLESFEKLENATALRLFLNRSS
jgi:hypothetical protein